MYKQKKIKSLRDITNFAISFAKILSVGDIILLKGSLGVGKTTFARSVIQFHCNKNTVVTSPTFSLLQKYEGLHFKISHFDLYKLKEPYQAKELDLEQSFMDGISIIEWPERLGYLTPKEAYILEFIKLSNVNTRYIKCIKK